MTFLTDGVVSLREVRRMDLPLLQEWRNDPELRARTREFRPLTELDQERWFERITGPNRKDYMYVVVEQETDNPVGVVGLCHHDPVNRSAEISFYVGASEARGKGFARRALTLLHGYGFCELNLYKIYAECYDFNEQSYRLLTKLGYKEEGRLKDHIWYDGWHDSIMMGLFRGD